MYLNKRNFIILLVGFCFVGSCTFHSPGGINLSNDVDGKSKIVDFAYGEKKSFNILGIGGNSSQSLLNDAHKQMIMLKPLREGQFYQNLTFETRRSYFGIGVATTVLVTADIAQKDSGEYSRYKLNYFLFSPVVISGKYEQNKIEKVLVCKREAIVHGELTHRKGKPYKVAYFHPHTKSFRYQVLPRNQVFFLSPIPAGLRQNQPGIGSKVQGVWHASLGLWVDEGELIGWNNKFAVIKNQSGRFFISRWENIKPIKSS